MNVKFQSVAFMRFSALILAAMMAIPMAAGNGKDVDTSKSNYPIGKGKISSGKRPKAPGIYDVYAWTEAGTLTVQFVRPAGVCEMTVTSASDPVGQTYTFRGSVLDSRRHHRPRTLTRDCHRGRRDLHR